jgi:uncharacterized protein
MTNSPEATTPDSPREPAENRTAESLMPGPEGGAPAPASDSPAQASDAAASAPASAPAPASAASREQAALPDVLDRGTYERIREPRSPGRLPLGDGTWHQLARQYVWVQLISTGVVVVIVLAVVLLLTLLWGQWWAWIPGGIFLGILVWTIAITPRQARAYGYQLRRDDLVFRRGILWQRVVAVPYGRMQLIDITHGPLDRGFGIAQLKLVTAAASTGVVIPGLRQEAAEQLRDTLVDVAEERRTGL